jgi:hypothetical protein
MSLLNPVHQEKKPIIPYLRPTSLAQLLKYQIYKISTIPNPYLIHFSPSPSSCCTQGSLGQRPCILAPPPQPSPHVPFTPRSASRAHSPGPPCSASRARPTTRAPGCAHLPRSPCSTSRVRLATRTPDHACSPHRLGPLCHLSTHPAFTRGIPSASTEGGDPSSRVEP